MILGIYPRNLESCVHTKVNTHMHGGFTGADENQKQPGGPSEMKSIHTTESYFRKERKELLTREVTWTNPPGNQAE